MLLSLPVWSLCGRQVQTSLPPTQIKRFKAACGLLHLFLIRYDASRSSAVTFWTASSNRLSWWVSVIKLQPEHSGIFITGYNYGEVCVFMGGAKGLTLSWRVKWHPDRKIRCSICLQKKKKAYFEENGLANLFWLSSFVTCWLMT